MSESAAPFSDTPIPAPANKEGIACTYGKEGPSATLFKLDDRICVTAHPAAPSLNGKTSVVLLAFDRNDNVRMTLDHHQLPLAIPTARLRNETCLTERGAANDRGCPNATRSEEASPPTVADRASEGDYVILHPTDEATGTTMLLSSARTLSKNAATLSSRGFGDSTNEIQRT